MRIEVDGRDTVDLLHRQRDLEQAAHRRWLRTGEDRAESARFDVAEPGRSSRVGDSLSSPRSATT